MPKPCGPDCKEWEKTKELMTRLIMEASLSERWGCCKHEAAILAASKEIDVEVKKWNDRNFRNVQGYYSLSTYKGHEASTKDFKVLVYGCAGRLLITIQDHRADGKYKGAWMTLIGPEDPTDCKEDGSTRAGWQGLAATKEEAVALLRDSMAMPCLNPDKTVGII